MGVCYVCFFLCCKEHGCGNAYLHSSLPADELRFIKVIFGGMVTAMNCLYSWLMVSGGGWWSW